MSGRAWVTKYSRKAEHYILIPPATAADMITRRPPADTPRCVSVYPQYYCSCGAYQLFWQVYK